MPLRKREGELEKCKWPVLRHRSISRSLATAVAFFNKDTASHSLPQGTGSTFQLPYKKKISPLYPFRAEWHNKINSRAREAAHPFIVRFTQAADCRFSQEKWWREWGHGRSAHTPPSCREETRSPVSAARGKTEWELEKQDETCLCLRWKKFK